MTINEKRYKKILQSWISDNDIDTLNESLTKLIVYHGKTYDKLYKLVNKDSFNVAKSTFGITSMTDERLIPNKNQLLLVFTNVNAINESDYDIKNGKDYTNEYISFGKFKKIKQIRNTIYYEFQSKYSQQNFDFSILTKKLNNINTEIESSFSINFQDLTRILKNGQRNNK